MPDALIADITPGVPTATDEIELQRTASGASIRATLAQLFAASGFTLVAPNFVGPVTITSGQLNLPDGSKPAPSLVFTTDPTSGWYKSGAAQWSWVAAGVAAIALTATALRVKSDSVVGWCVGETDTPMDTAFGRNAVGVAEVNSGVLGVFRDMRLRNLYYALPTVVETASGPVTSDYLTGYDSAVGDLVYIDVNALWQKTDANTVYSGMLGITLEVKLAGQQMRVALPGSTIYSAVFPAFTVGAPVYMSENAGVVTQTKPVTSLSATRVVGWAVDTQKLFFFPSPDYITHV